MLVEARVKKKGGHTIIYCVYTFCNNYQRTDVVGKWYFSTQYNSSYDAESGNTTPLCKELSRVYLDIT